MWCAIVYVGLVCCGTLLFLMIHYRLAPLFEWLASTELSSILPSWACRVLGIPRDL